MGILNVFRVIVSGSTTSLVLLTFIVILSQSQNEASASVCVRGEQFLDPSLQICVNCTSCAANHVVSAPCEIHRDTVCAPISELFKTSSSSNPHRHRHNYNNHNHRHRSQVQKPKNEGEIVWRYGDDVGKPTPLEQEYSEVEEESEILPTVAHLAVTSTEAPFSGTESLIWDWQAIALTSAVFSCILFFLVITLYSFHQAKQWRRLKENFDAEIEDMSAKLSLMAAANSFIDQSDLEAQIQKECLQKELMSPISPDDGNYLNINNRCVYLEQLLSDRKDTKIKPGVGGNLYIEGANTKTS